MQRLVAKNRDEAMKFRRIIGQDIHNVVVTSHTERVNFSLSTHPFQVY